ncbi:uncharacterized protein LOC130920515 [Corythoichthys intestinalis]|uniref:uncharacterized protein LOC130920515 n=1 Tax=Corythoichthys intestinalis TaxID=161448 RepID=UPI0025A4FB16|nr:uncharacterized protein LOC130920515 [Corythoichthys intestinalis]
MCWDEKRKKSTLLLSIIMIYFYCHCSSVPPSLWKSRISGQEESPFTERGGIEQDDLLDQGRKLYKFSESGYDELWHQSESSNAGHVPESDNIHQQGLIWAWTKGKAIRKQSLPENDEGYESDITAFSRVPGKVLISSSDSVPHISEWLAMKPMLQCADNFMTFTASGEGFSHLLVDKGGASPVSIFHLSLYCGYQVRTSWSDLQIIVPYDACYITQENGSYVLSILWWGSPLKLSCPVAMPTVASAIPVVLCSPYGMAVQLYQQENNLPILRVFGNEEWAPFVSAQCAYRADSQPDELIFFIPFIAPCFRDGQELQFAFNEQEMILSCRPRSSPQSNNPLASAQSPAIEPIDKPDYHRTTDRHLPYPHIPKHSSPGLQPDTSPSFFSGSVYEVPLQQFPYDSNPLPVAPGNQNAHLPDYRHTADPGFLSPTFPDVYPPSSMPAMPWFSQDSVSGLSSNSLPAVPKSSASDQIVQLPAYPQMIYPGFLAPKFPPSVPHFFQDNGPGASFHQFQYSQNPSAPPTPAPPTQNQKPQSPGHSQDIYPSFMSPHFPQVSPPASLPASPPEPAAPQDPRPPTLLDYFEIPSYPLPTSATLLPGPFTPLSSEHKRPSRPHYQLPSNSDDLYNPYEFFFYPKTDDLHHPSTSTPSYPFAQNPPTEEHKQPRYHRPFIHSPYTPTHSPVPQYPTTRKPVFSGTSTGVSVVPKAKVFCSSKQMLVQLPPGPISGIAVKDLKGNEITVQDAPKECGYLANIGKDGKIHLGLQLDTRCHLTVKDNMYIIGVIYMTQNGRTEVQVYCPVSTYSSDGDCNFPREQRLQCGKGPVSEASCLALGCCFIKHLPACFYPLDECTVDRHFVFSVPASLTEPPLSPGLLGVANNSTCKPVKVTNNYALFKLPMDGCGTRRVEVGKTLIYMVEVVNTVQTISLNYGTITRESPVRLLVECRYVPGSALTVSYLVKTPTLGPAVQTQGVFGVQLRLAKDAQYTSYHPQYHQPLQMLLGKPLYLEVRMLNAPDPSLRLLVHYCVAYSRSGNSVWVLLYNGCPNPLDPTSQVVLSDPQPPSPHAQIRRFTMSTFQFLPEAEIKDLAEEIYFMCATEACSELDGPCVEGCFGH